MSVWEIFGHKLIAENLSVSNSNRLHVVIFQFLLYSFELYSIDFSKMMGNFIEVLNFSRLFLKLSRFICNLAVGSLRSFVTADADLLLFCKTILEDFLLLITCRYGHLHG